MGSYYCKVFIGRKHQRTVGGTKREVYSVIREYENNPERILEGLTDEQIDETPIVMARFYCYRKNPSKSKKLKMTVVRNYSVVRSKSDNSHSVSLIDEHMYHSGQKIVSNVKLINTISNGSPLHKFITKYSDMTEFNSNSMHPIEPIVTNIGKTDNRPLKVFLSHPMSGLTDEQVYAIRNQAMLELAQMYGEIEIIDNYNHENVPPNAGRLWHLGVCIQQMEQADGVYFCGDWHLAKGCMIEREICTRYGILILNDGRSM